MWSWLVSKLSSPAVKDHAPRPVAHQDQPAPVPFDPEARLEYTCALFCVDESSPEALSTTEAACLENLHALTRSGKIADLVPRLSGTLPKLLSSLKENPPAAQLARQVSADPQLLSGVMKVANSPAFRVRKERIDNIEHAVVILGDRNLRDVIASVTFRPILCVDSMSLIDADLAKNMWEDAIDCASECRKVDSDKDGFALYLCGMTHAVGLTAVLRYLFDKAPAMTGPLSRTFAREVNALYPKISSVMARQWELPEMTGQVLEALASGDWSNPLAADVNHAILEFLTRVVSKDGTPENAPA